MCITDQLFLFIVPLTGTIWVFLFSCLFLRSIQWKCVLSEPLCAYRIHWRRWIARCGCEPVRACTSWASSCSSEASSAFRWCKWRHPHTATKRQEQLCAWSAFPFNIERCLKWPTAECKNESWSCFCQCNPQSSLTAGLNIYWRNIVTKLN